MPLQFLNPSRSYDAEKGHVRFMGHDGMTSVPFAVEVGALTHDGGQLAEQQALAAFDAACEAVHGVALEVYRNSKQTTYLLTEADFH